MRLVNLLEEWHHPERYAHLPQWKDPIIQAVIGGVATVFLTGVVLLVAVWANWL